MMFIKYILSKWRLFTMLSVFCIVFAGIFFLYRLPVETVLYAALICLVLGFIFAAVDYMSFLRKYKMLRDYTASQNDESLLPEPRTLLDSEYDKALRIGASLRREELTRAAKASSEQTGYFTIWAHQVKIPLSAMKLILQGEDTKNSRELEAQLFLTEQYVHMVLAYLRSGSDSTDYVFRDCKLSALIRLSLHRFAPMFIRKKLMLDFKPCDITVLTDEKWLAFVFEQVLSNAIKYTQQGTIYVCISEDNSVKDKNTVVLTVRDTGIGISEADLPRVFENSYTGENGRIDMRATGLGLYLTRQVLNKLGHRIEITSKVGTGTEVRIYLPAANKTKFD